MQASLQSGEPLDLLAMVSGLLAVTDPRGADPFRPDERPSLQELVESFIDTPHPETTAVLAVIRALSPDDLMRARIARALAQRTDPLPDWVLSLDRAEVTTEVWLLTESLGDGDDYFLGVTLPTGHHLSALVYLDHNLGTVVKDAFVVPEPLAVLLDQVAGAIDAEQALTRTDPADARAVLEEAIADGVSMYPPLESESWPMCRPVVEWMLRMLPTGGRVPERPEWSESQLAALSDDFFASSYGRPLDDEDRRRLLDSVFWFGTDYGPGDPLRWSPAAVEIFLLDWLPRKVMADADYLAQAPELLRAFVRYAHDRRGLGAGLTAETLAAVDAREPQFLVLSETTVPEGPAALLAQLLEANGGQLPDELAQALAGVGGAQLFADGGFGDRFPTEEDLAEQLVDGLAARVGGLVHLDELTAEMLPDEPFVWDGIPDDIRPVVAEVLAACDGCADALLDVEHRTAMRRFLRRAAAADPALFRRKASPVRGAAAIAWALCRANETAGFSGSPLSVQELLAWFGVKGSVSQRAEPLLRAVGADPQWRYGEIALGSPDLLVARFRAELIEYRDRYRQV